MPVTRTRAQWSRWNDKPFKPSKKPLARFAESTLEALAEQGVIVVVCKEKSEYPKLMWKVERKQ